MDNTHHTFNLDPPVDFRGLNPDLPLEVYYQRLPHWRQRGATYFVTFRLNDALPQDKLRQLKELRRHWEATHPSPRSDAEWNEYASEVFARSECWMDEGYGACYFRDPVNARLLANALCYYQNSRCRVPCLVVMPNHAHAVMKPLRDFKLEDTLKLIKGYVSHEIKSSHGVSGSIWERESYDRIIRDEEHLFNVVQYIGRNGRSAGLSPSEYLRWIDPEWQNQGWDFLGD